MLKSYNDNTGAFTWHCNTVASCSNHNCRDIYGNCQMHENLPKSQRPAGAELKADHKHPQVQFTADDIVALPPCPLCGSQMFLKVAFTAEELAAPNITMTMPDGTIFMHPAVDAHTKLAAKMLANGKVKPPKGSKGQ